MMKNKNTGLYFGSFNPIHHGHLIIANYILTYTPLNEVWFIVSPQSPLKEKKQLANEYHRLEMVNLAIGDFNKFKALDIEFTLPKPSFTVDTLARLSEKYPSHQFNLIMGSDQLATFHKWKNYSYILQHYRLLVYPRPGNIENPYISNEHVQIIHAPQMELSSTFIRNAIHEKKDIHCFLPEKVLQYIFDCNLYR